MSDTANLTRDIPAPRTTDQALDPAWLSQALARVTGGGKITKVETVETLRTMATKIRFKADWEGGSAPGTGNFCLKAFLDLDEQAAKAGATTIIEADFYSQIAPQQTVRVPTCVATITDRPGAQGVIIMRDLVAEGARFCTALEAFSPDQAAASLEQLARLHARPQLLDTAPWITGRVAELSRIMPEALLQELLNGPRREGLDPAILDAGRVLKGVRALAERDAGQPQTLVHGDCHAGNIFQTKDGPGLIDWQVLQRGGWALDIVYHISAVLPVEVAEREEWALLDHYLAAVRGFGGQAPDLDEAREQYRAAAAWGYFLWAITRKVDPAITNTFVNRLGNAVMRHDTYRRLGV